MSNQIKDAVQSAGITLDLKIGSQNKKRLMLFISELIEGKRNENCKDFLEATRILIAEDQLMQVKVFIKFNQKQREELQYQIPDNG